MLYLISFIFFWLCRVACGILVPLSGLELRHPALGVWHLALWTAKEVSSIELYTIPGGAHSREGSAYSQPGW